MATKLSRNEKQRINEIIYNLLCTQNFTPSPSPQVKISYAPSTKFQSEKLMEDAISTSLSASELSNFVMFRKENTILSEDFSGIGYSLNFVENKITFTIVPSNSFSNIENTPACKTGSISSKLLKGDFQTRLSKYNYNTTLSQLSKNIKIVSNTTVEKYPFLQVPEEDNFNENKSNYKDLLTPREIACFALKKLIPLLNVSPMIDKGVNLVIGVNDKTLDKVGMLACLTNPSDYTSLTFEEIFRVEIENEIDLIFNHIFPKLPKDCCHLILSWCDLPNDEDFFKEIDGKFECIVFNKSINDEKYVNYTALAFINGEFRIVISRAQFDGNSKTTLIRVDRYFLLPKVILKINISTHNNDGVYHPLKVPSDFTLFSEKDTRIAYGSDISGKKIQLQIFDIWIRNTDRNPFYLDYLKSSYFRKLSISFAYDIPPRYKFETEISLNSLDFINSFDSYISTYQIYYSNIPLIISLFIGEKIPLVEFRKILLPLINLKRVKVMFIIISPVYEFFYEIYYKTIEHFEVLAILPDTTHKNHSTIGETDNEVNFLDQQFGNTEKYKCQIYQQYYRYGVPPSTSFVKDGVIVNFQREKTVWRRIKERCIFIDKKKKSQTMYISKYFTGSGATSLLFRLFYRLSKKYGNTTCFLCDNSTLSQFVVPIEKSFRIFLIDEEFSDTYSQLSLSFRTSPTLFIVIKAMEWNQSPVGFPITPFITKEDSQLLFDSMRKWGCTSTNLDFTFVNEKEFDLHNVLFLGRNEFIQNYRGEQDLINRIIDCCVNDSNRGILQFLAFMLFFGNKYQQVPFVKQLKDSLGENGFQLARIRSQSDIFTMGISNYAVAWRLLKSLLDNQGIGYWVASINNTMKGFYLTANLEDFWKDLLEKHGKEHPTILLYLGDDNSLIFLDTLIENDCVPTKTKPFVFLLKSSVLRKKKLFEDAFNCSEIAIQLARKMNPINLEPFELNQFICSFYKQLSVKQTKEAELENTIKLCSKYDAKAKKDFLQATLQIQNALLQAHQSKIEFISSKQQPGQSKKKDILACLLGSLENEIRNTGARLKELEISISQTHSFENEKEEDSKDFAEHVAPIFSKISRNS